MQHQDEADQRDRELAATLAALKAMNLQGPRSKGEEAMDSAVNKLPGRGEWIKAAPGVAFVCATLVILTFATMLMVLTITGSPTDGFFRLINLFFNAFTAFGTIGLVGVALIHARRTMENRKIAEKGQEEAHRAADKAEVAAVAVNGALETRIARAMTPLVKSAVQEAVTHALANQQPCSGQDEEEDGP